MYITIVTVCSKPIHQYVLPTFCAVASYMVCMHMVHVTFVLCMTVAMLLIYLCGHVATPFINRYIQLLYAHNSYTHTCAHIQFN